MEEDRSVFKILKSKPTGKKKDLQRGLGEVGKTVLEMDLNVIGVNTRNWFDSAQDRVIGEPLLMGQ